jgi:hypothetical protein
MAKSTDAMAPVILTNTGNTGEALLSASAADHRPEPAPNDGALASSVIAELETINVSAARNTTPPVGRYLAEGDVRRAMRSRQ